VESSSLKEQHTRREKESEDLWVPRVPTTSGASKIVNKVFGEHSQYLKMCVIFVLLAPVYSIALAEVLARGRMQRKSARSFCCNEILTFFSLSLLSMQLFLGL